MTPTPLMMNKFSNILSKIKSTHVLLFVALLIMGILVAISVLAPSPASRYGTQTASAALSIPIRIEESSIIAQSAFIYDTITKETLYSKNSDSPMALASVTKLMLAIVVAEILSPDDLIIISDSALMEEGDSGLLVGEIWRVQDLLDFTLIVSSNDGAKALSEAVAPIINSRYPNAPANKSDATIWFMNKRAKEIGLTKSYFLSVSGLDASESMAGAYGSAKDMAMLMTYAIQEHLDTVSETTQIARSITSESGLQHDALTTNDALGNIPGIIAGKTGYTDLAGGNLLVAFDVSIGHPVVVIALGATREGRFSDIERLTTLARESIAK